MNLRWLILLLGVALYVQVEAQSGLSLAWWNVENYFDACDNPASDDDEFTPQGSYHWTYRRMCAKRDSIYKVIAAMGCPDIVAMAEVENDTVMKELCLGTPLRKAGYGYVLTSMPDARGIGCAVMFRRDRFTVDTVYDIPVVGSRGIMVVVGRTKTGDSVVVLANHWASRRNGGGDELRNFAANTLRSAIAECHRAMPSACIVAMGDMNCVQTEPPLAAAMGFGDTCCNAEGVELLTCRLSEGEYSYCWQQRWQNIDHTMIRLPENGRFQVVSYRVFAPGFMFVEHDTRFGRQPFRTFYGRRYQGGFSDHLPLLLHLTVER